MTTIYPGPTYPAALFSWSPRLVDTVDEVVVNHQNTAFTVLEALQAKLNIDNAPVQNVGGIQFDPVGKATNPSGAGDPTVWVDNSGGAGFPLIYTDDLGVAYDLRSSALYVPTGVAYTCAMGMAVGDLASITGADTVDDADSATGAVCRGIIIRVYGGGTTCDLLYVGELTISGWGLSAGSTYYLSTTGGLATSVPGGWTIQQEIGFARSSNTLVFSPQYVSH